MKILFLCTGNSCRSQMAEGWARTLKGDVLDPCSAGIEMHGLNPLAVRVMAEAGVDISGQRSKTVDAVKDVPFDYVVTVCGHANGACSGMGLCGAPHAKPAAEGGAGEVLRTRKPYIPDCSGPENWHEHLAPEAIARGRAAFSGRSRGWRTVALGAPGLRGTGSAASRESLSVRPASA